jgi:hypothetical protein
MKRAQTDVNMCMYVCLYLHVCIYTSIVGIYRYRYIFYVYYVYIIYIIYIWGELGF